MDDLIWMNKALFWQALPKTIKPDGKYPKLLGSRDI